MRFVGPDRLRFLTSASSGPPDAIFRPRVELDMLRENRPAALVARVLDTTNVPLNILTKLVVLYVPTETLLARAVPLVMFRVPTVFSAAGLFVLVRPRNRVLFTRRSALTFPTFTTPAIGFEFEVLVHCWLPT